MAILQEQKSAMYRMYGMAILHRYTSKKSVMYRDVRYGDFASLQGQGLFLQPYCISTIHGGHVTY